ncbi:MAG: hypothetical protein PHY05_03490 [Methanothrix sp.]|nr:hypothetical protein [Methanothrix sp.]
MKKPVIIFLLLIIIITVCPSAGQLLNDSSNETAFFNESIASYEPNLSFIWSVTGIEKDPVIMVLNQEGSDLYGQAKYEPNSGQAWNGIVVGSVQEDRIDLVMTFLKNAVQFSGQLKGTYDETSGLIKGSILQVSNGKVSLKSDFEAMPINPDISSYTPAREVTPSVASASSPETNATMQKVKEILPPASSEKSKYHDVREDADRILTGVGDISQIPIGMSGL